MAQTLSGLRWAVVNPNVAWELVGTRGWEIVVRETEQTIRIDVPEDRVE
jgi:RNase P/RNase MRP subunit p29